MQVTHIAGKFDAGFVIPTPEAEEKISEADRFVCLIRHVNGDWGDLGPQDWATNERALKYGGRLFSRFRSQGETIFYIITDADRRRTTILLTRNY